MTDLKRHLKTESLYLSLVLLLFFAAVFVNYNWFLNDISPPSFDEAGHLINAYRQYDYYSRGSVISSFRVYQWFYPPFLYQTTALLYLLTGPSLLSSFFVLQIFQCILLFSLYFTGKKCGNSFTGFLCAAAGAFFPFALFMSHRYYLDYPSTAMAALAFVFLINCESFSRRNQTLLFFAVTGLGMMIRWTTPIFLILPFAIVFAGFFKSQYEIFKSTGKTDFIKYLIACTAAVAGGIWIYHRGNSDSLPSDFEYLILILKSLLPLFLISGILIFNRKIEPQVRFFFTSVCIFFVIIWHYYIPALPFLSANMTKGASWGVGEGDAFDFISYLRMFVFDYQGIFGTLLIVAGFIAFFVKKDKNNVLWLSFAGFICGFIILFLLPNRDVRYFLPLLVFSAPLSVFWFGEIKNNRVKIALSAVFFTFMCVSWLGWLFLQKVPQEKTAPYEYALIQPLPCRDDWHYNEIMDCLEKISAGKKMVVLFSEVRSQRSTPITVNSIFMHYLVKTGSPLEGFNDDCEVKIQDKYCNSYIFSNYPVSKGGNPDLTAELLIYDRDERPDLPEPVQRFYEKYRVRGERELIDEFELPNHLCARISVYKPGISGR
ncbi:MAG: glycosyltransferase family 39 protein [Firmicutes bacterium]|nr:glycosyltransferase family 39 protein [Bacillota bacterium]